MVTYLNGQLSLEEYQCFVLGPLLFPLFNNENTTQNYHSNYHLFANDLQIYKHFPITESVTAISQENYDIDTISS